MEETMRRVRQHLTYANVIEAVRDRLRIHQERGGQATPRFE
jgi:hypothetical protein